MSFVARGTRRLPVAPEVAFDRLADLGSWPEWMPSIVLQAKRKACSAEASGSS